MGIKKSVDNELYIPLFQKSDLVSRNLSIALHQLPNLNESIDACKRIVSLIPNTWLEVTDVKVTGFESFGRCLGMLASSVMKDGEKAFGDQERKRTKLMITKIVSLLMRLQQFEVARNIARDFKGDVKESVSESVE